MYITIKQIKITMNDLGVVLHTGFRTFFETELDTLTCTSFAGEIAQQFLPPPLQIFLEDRLLI